MNVKFTLNSFGNVDFSHYLLFCKGEWHRIVTCKKTQMWPCSENLASWKKQTKRKAVHQIPKNGHERSHTGLARLKTVQKFESFAISAVSFDWLQPFRDDDIYRMLQSGLWGADMSLSSQSALWRWYRAHHVSRRDRGLGVFSFTETPFSAFRIKNTAGISLCG